MGSKSKYTLRVSERAAEMLVAHVRFLARLSENAALRLIREFEKNAEKLESTPEIYPWLSDPLLPHHKYRKLLFEKRYLIIYQVKTGRPKDYVYIDAVVDCRQDYHWLL
jgi:plasmid stabilization system protein ParE